ncbi:MAG: RHS repeat protein, partial [Planctomycetaceae bacterium]|nr:RHS repeat protein [Planctomycetaceae bacterium]
TSSYDPVGQVVAVQDADNQVSTTLYDAVGQTIATVNPLGERTSAVYDAAGQQTVSINPLGNRTTSVYDPVGRVQATVNPLGEISTTVYDAAGQAIAAVNALGYRTTSSYDPVGQVVAVQDAAGEVTTTVYDLAGRPEATINPLGYRTTSIYDAAGQTVAQVNERGFRYTSTYDAAGQEVVTIDPLNRQTTYTYDPVGNQQTRIDARGNLTTYVYDSRNLLTQRQYPDGSRATFVYNALGDRTVMANQSERSTTTYDPLRRKESVVTAAGKRITYTYDAVGRNDQMTVLDAGVFTYAYDANSQLTLIQNPQGERTSFSYDAAGRQTLKELANGTRATMIYDAAGQVTRTTNRKSDDEVICQFDYTYDPIGNKQTITTADGSLTTYSYDATSQLTEDWRTSSTLSYRNTFLWDATGNRVLTIKDGDRTTSTFDAANQHVFSDSSSGRTTYTFDADGSRTVVELPDGSRTTTTYDYENRDVLIVLPSGIRNTMAYDPDGLRVQVDNSAGTTKFVYNNQQYLLETDGSNVLTAVYTQQPGNYSNLTSQYRFNGSVWLPSYSHYDSLGSTAALTNADETVTDTYVYDAWGARLASTGTTVNPFQWLGRVGYYQNPDTGLVYVIMRTYSPVTGTWTTLDILRFVDGMNMYKAYFVPGGMDPSGLQPDPWSDPWRGGHYGGPAYQPWLDSCGTPPPCGAVFHADAVAKSFINGVPVIGTLPAWRTLPPGLSTATIPLYGHVILLAQKCAINPGTLTTATGRLNLLACLVGKLDAFNQFPLNDAKDQTYRLYTRALLKFCCQCDTLRDPNVVFTDNDGGKELPGVHGTINMSDVSVTRIDASRVRVSWQGWGMPHPLVEPGMQWVAARTSVNIWHAPEIELSCKDGQGHYSVVGFNGSKFPSRRLWINGNLEAWAKQGAFADLWWPNPQAPTFVK